MFWLFHLVLAAYLYILGCSFIFLGKGEGTGGKAQAKGLSDMQKFYTSSAAASVTRCVLASEF